MSKKVYVVWRGRNPGLYKTWTECKKQVDGFPGAQFKSFPNQELAEAAFGVPSGLSKKTTDKKTVKKSRNKHPAKKKRSFSIPEADLIIFSDGCCSKNPGGMIGSGISVYRNQAFTEAWYGLFSDSGTSNLAELNALHQALLIAKGHYNKGTPSFIFSDSNYSVKAVTLWAAGWARNGWKTREKKDVKNQEIIAKCLSLYTELKDKVTIEHCPGHAGIEGNEIADRMAFIATQRQEQDFSLFRDFDTVSDILNLTSDPY
jgi:ribonuclease HI